MSSTLATEKQSIMAEFESYIKDMLVRFKIGKGVREYERAKRLIQDTDMGADDSWKAIKVIAEWCNV